MLSKSSLTMQAFPEVVVIAMILSGSIVGEHCRGFMDKGIDSFSDYGWTHAGNGNKNVFVIHKVKISSLLQ